MLPTSTSTNLYPSLPPRCLRIMHIIPHTSPVAKIPGSSIVPHCELTQCCIDAGLIIFTIPPREYIFDSLLLFSVPFISSRFQQLGIAPRGFDLEQEREKLELDGSCGENRTEQNMDPRFFQTLVEPSRVAIVPVRTEVYTHVAASLASLTGTAVGSILTSATATSTITPATHSPSIPSSSPSLQSLPPQFPAFHDTSTPPIALLTLTAAILCALILLFALSYFLLQRCTRGACPSCRACASEVEKWRRGELRRVTPDMVQRRMRAWDLEEGGGDGDGKEVRSGEVGKEGGTEEYFLVDAKLQHPRPVHLWDVRSRDSGCHLVGRRWSAGSGETERSLQEAEEQAFTSLAGTTQDPRNRDSGLQRAGNEVEEVSVVREEKEQAPKSGIYQMPPPRQGNQSRFIERFSLATNYDL